MQRVTIIQRGISQHRVSFYEMLRDSLARQNVDLVLVHGFFGPRDQTKSDLTTLPWATVIHNRVVRIFGKEIYWQPALVHSLHSDLVIVEQANRLLLNYVLLPIRRLFRFKLAFWGHGKNYQARNNDHWLERYKRLYSTRVDWWFPYTKHGANLLQHNGYPADRITIVQNSADTNLITESMRSVKSQDLEVIRHSMNITGANVCLYCGGMYKDKRLDFLLAACGQLRARIPDFHMIFIGSGPEQQKVQHASNAYPWIHYVGAKYGKDRVPYFMLSNAFLMPGLVGLAIVDCFAARVPLFTTDIPTHSPEITYLENGINGIMTCDSLEAFVQAVVDYLGSGTQQRMLQEGCQQSAERYSLENMVNNFANGVLQCLGK
jgi:glycosyltransferase involved in cell wall biosynthesis